MSDEALVAKLRQKANELCVIANEAAAEGLHVTISIAPYIHTHSAAGNIGSGFKALVLVRRESHF